MTSPMYVFMYEVNGDSLRLCPICGYAVSRGAKPMYFYGLLSNHIKYKHSEMWYGDLYSSLAHAEWDNTFQLIHFAEKVYPGEFNRNDEGLYHVFDSLEVIV